MLEEGETVPVTNGYSREINDSSRPATLTTRPICIEPDAAYSPQNESALNGAHVTADDRERHRSSVDGSVALAIRVKPEPADDDDDVIITGETISTSHASNVKPRTNGTTAQLHVDSPRPLVTVRLAGNGSLTQASVSNGAPPVAALRELIGSDGRRAEVVMQARPQGGASRLLGSVSRPAAPTAGKPVRIVGNKIVRVPQWNPPRIAPATAATPRTGSVRPATVVAVPSPLAVSTSAVSGGRKKKSLSSPRAANNVHSNGILPDGSTLSPAVTSVRAFIEGIGLFPIYKPSAQDMAAVCSQPLNQYKCNACGDSFLFESSLQDHLSRKSCLLEYDCTVCGHVVTFHNRCLLLLHFADDALQTNSPPSLLNYDRVKLKPLPSEDEDESGDNMVTCVFCRLSMPPSSVVSHFSSNGRSVKDARSMWSCDKCGRLLANRCALEAHANVHSQQTSLVCPECGAEFSGDSFDAFQHHVRFTCLHFALQTLLKCPTCKQLKQMATFVSHLVEHMTIYFKCSACPMAFHSQTLLREHKDTQHGDTASSGRQIVKCQICAAILQHAAQLDLVKHMHSHALSTWKDLIVAAYVCPLCSDLNHFPERHALLQHLHQAHGSADTSGEICDLCGQVFSRAVKLTQHKEHCKGFTLPSAEQSASYSKHKEVADEIAPANGNGSIDVASDNDDSNSQKEEDESLRCTKCQVMCQNELILAKHMRRHEVIASKKATFASRRPPTFSGRQVPIPSPDLDFLCTTCDVRFADQTLLDGHRRDAHGESVLYPCLLCGLIYESELQRTEHTKLVHETSGGQARYACPLCAESGKPVFKGNQAALSRHITQGHKVKKDRAKELASKSCGDREQTHEEESSPPAKRLKSGDSALFVCAKCGHSTESRGLFMLHIATHRRLQEDGVQCFECGLIFTVLPAVKRHLHVVHGILDFDAYTKETGFNVDGVATVTAERKVTEPRSSSSTEELGGQRDCSVCGKVFDSETVLRQHMRTHGMAFITKRATAPDSS